jgi:PAS domain S-box-containing protein
VIRDDQGRVTDYLILEANPALHRILRRDTSLVGKLQSEVLQEAPPAWLRACQAAMDDGPVTFEYHRDGSERWLEIHLSRVTHDELAQLVVDITERKRSEHRQAEMFDELNHRVKNNLALVSAMLSMQARSTPSPEVRERLTAAVERVQTIADVHGSLYRTGRRDDVDFAAYLADLCDRLRRSVLDSERIALKLEAEPVVLPLDQAVTLGVIVNELVTNAAKHAYPPPKSGLISLELEHAGRELLLTVGDSGPGLPREPPPSGLGMRIVRSLTQQLGASLTVERHPGATFRVRAPLPEGEPEPAADQQALF